MKVEAILVILLGIGLVSCLDSKCCQYKDLQCYDNGKCEITSQEMMKANGCTDVCVPGSCDLITALTCWGMYRIANSSYTGNQLKGKNKEPHSLGVLERERRVQQGLSHHNTCVLTDCVTLILCPLSLSTLFSIDG